MIDTARDNLDQDKLEKQAGVVDDEYVSSNSDSSVDGEEQVPDGSAEHKQGVVDQLRSYKRRDKALHRQHRGLMQWKVGCPFVCVCVCLFPSVVSPGTTARPAPANLEEPCDRFPARQGG